MTSVMKLSSLLIFVVLTYAATFAAEGPRKKTNRKQLDSTALAPDTVTVKDVEVIGDRLTIFSVSRPEDVSAGAIYASKKTEQIRLRDLTMNTATNNARQAFSTVAGLNIWESDGGGQQLGIGGRGLSPNRTSNFTTRQNGYDIAADPLGYPESYYTPPLDAVDRIDIVRGAGSLRYGTQFGGMINFVMRKPPAFDPITARVRVSGGSFGFASLYTELGGTVGDVGYIALYQGRRNDGWRPSSGFVSHTAYASVVLTPSPSLRLIVDYTHMSSTAQQPGGLTDRLFYSHPDTSLRARNWFRVDWNLASVNAEWFIDEGLLLQSLTSVNVSGRSALGNLDRINVADRGQDRTLIDGRFTNLTNETTLQADYTAFGTSASTALFGLRLFSGRTRQRQGDGTNGSDADFTFRNPDYVEGSDYTFPNSNVAVFAESVIRLGGGFSVVPGIRAEYIRTASDGYYRQRLRDLAGNVIVDSTTVESRSRERSFIIAGLGLSYHLDTLLELYGNVSQNYRSITFSDLRIDNPNLVIDQNIGDERGYTVDLGFRGRLATFVAFDVSVFYLRYNNRISEVLRADAPPLYLPYRYRTNVSDAWTGGVEFVADVHLDEVLSFPSSWPHAHFIVNGSLLDGRYDGTGDASVRGRKVEFVPPYTFRSGITAHTDNVKFSCLWSFVGAHYTDATNATYTASAITGEIPAYNVLDATVSWTIDRYTVELSCNNVLDSRYFTRRAESYPGPGIIPADARSFTLTVQASF